MGAHKKEFYLLTNTLINAYICLQLQYSVLESVYILFINANTTLRSLLNNVKTIISQLLMAICFGIKIKYNTIHYTFFIFLEKKRLNTDQQKLEI